MTSRVCAPLVAPNVNELTLPPLLLGSAVPSDHGANVTVYVPGTVMHTLSVFAGITPVDQLEETPQSPLVAFADPPPGPYQVSQPTAWATSGVTICTPTVERPVAAKVMTPTTGRQVHFTMGPFER